MDICCGLGIDTGLWHFGRNSLAMYRHAAMGQRIVMIAQKVP
jgi:hypothetical protein